MPTSEAAFDLNCEVSVPSATVLKRVGIHRPKFSLRLVGGEDLPFAKRSQMQLRIANEGDTVIPSLSLLAMNGSKSLDMLDVSELPPGQTRQIPIWVTPHAAGSHELTVQGKVGSTETKATAKFSVKRGKATLDVLGAPRLFANQWSDYEIRVRNDGNADLEQVKVSLRIPTAIDWAPSQDAKLENGEVHWLVKRLAPNEETSFICTLRANSGGQHRLFAVAEYDGDSSERVGSIDAIAAPDVRLRVHDPVGPQSLESVLEYEVEVVNVGTDGAKQVAVEVVLADTLVITDVTGTAAIKGQRVYFKPLDELAPGYKMLFTVRAKPTEPGVHEFLAILRSTVPEARFGFPRNDRCDQRWRNAEPNPIGTVGDFAAIKFCYPCAERISIVRCSGLRMSATTYSCVTSVQTSFRSASMLENSVSGSRLP